MTNITSQNLVRENYRRGRGSRTNRSSRFGSEIRESFDDGWCIEDDLAPFQTHVQMETARTIITTNNSPDINFDQSINAYRG